MKQASDLRPRGLERAPDGVRKALQPSRTSAALRGMDYESQMQHLTPPEADAGEGAEADQATQPSASSSPFAGIALLEKVLAGGGYVRYGCSDREAVAAIQQVLNRLGHDVGEADGLWGPKTSAGVRSFQASAGLSVDAIAGQKTLSALQQSAGGGGGAAPLTPEPQPGGGGGPAPVTPEPQPGGGGTPTTPGPQPGKPPSERPEAEWDSAYGSRKTYIGQDYESYKDSLEAKASSEYGGEKKEQVALSLEELFYIYPDLGKDAENDADIMAKAKSYLKNLNAAFELMDVDTVEAQAVYLAHAAAESDQFRQMTESQGTRYQDDPEEAQLNERYLEQQYPAGSRNRRSIDPTGEWSFVGRGPLQVTHRYGYIQTLAYMEKQAERCEQEGNTEKAEQLFEAVEAIQADPRQASNPKYTFLFSTAYMKMMGGDRKVLNPGPKTFSGKGSESSWMTGGYEDKQHNVKRQAYERALEVLSKKQG